MAWNQPPEKPTATATKLNARKLRLSMTDAEKSLWKHLRGNFAGPGTHFRRQVAIGAYVADFCCLKHRLIVEVNGPIHDTVAAEARDAARDRTFDVNGYTIVHVANSEVSLNIRDVLYRIRTALGASTPTPSPSPQGGGESLVAFP
jgi:very-short-patch-repair endonuclease